MFKSLNITAIRSQANIDGSFSCDIVENIHQEAIHLRVIPWKDSPETIILSNQENLFELVAFEEDLSEALKLKLETLGYNPVLLVMDGYRVLGSDNYPLKGIPFEDIVEISEAL